MNLKEFLINSHFDAILFDASGVIYSNQGIVLGASETIQFSQNQASTYLVTNNSYSYPSYINDHLRTQANINIPETHIISSGHGLATDPKILEIITNKNIYFLGRDFSKQYILDAPIKSISPSANNADVIILANFTPGTNDSQIDQIIYAANQNPSTPIICCNPDIKIRSGESLLHVMGYYAQEIQKRIPQKIYWYGKPYKNFSNYVEVVLKKHNITPSKKVIFFDDNIKNVVNMQNDIGIAGCWVKQTGIFYEDDTHSLIEKYGLPSCIIDSIHLDNNIIINKTN